MKTKLLSLCGALLCAGSLSSCYVYDAPITWSSPRPHSVYGRGIYSPPVYRSYGPSYGHGHGHCAPPPPVCGPRHGRFF